ncbi:unnamed protein product, partial [Ixodes hexagonus]
MILKNRGSLLLTSPIVSEQAQPVCAIFRYHMFGALGAYMRISLEKDTVGDGTPGSVSEDIFVNHEGRTAVDRWFTVRRTMDMKDRFNKVVFRANIVGLNAPATSSFGLDDLQLDPEPCRPLFECDFEEDLCGYVNDFRGIGLQWLVGTGRLSKPELAPGLPPPPPPSSSA